MKSILVLCFLCVNLVVCRQNEYRAAIANSKDFRSYASMIQEAGRMNADIMVLPSSENLAETNDFDEITKSLSTAAKEAKLYIVAHLQEKIRCQSRDEIIRNNLVFDRQGAVVADYRKPLNTAANCTTPISTQTPVFTTDFGITFGLMMEEDLVLENPEKFKVKDFLVAGGLATDVPFLRGPQMALSWAYVTGANIVTSSAIFAGRSGLKTGQGRILAVNLNKNGEKDTRPLQVQTTELNTPEDLSQYIIRPLNVEASLQGYKETVCHGQFCCEFDVKTKYFGPSDNEVSYGLAVFDGVRHFANNHHISAQICSLVACAGLYKRTCSLGPNNSTNTLFERITISGNFSRSTSVQFPIILSSSQKHHIKFNSETNRNSNKACLSIENGRNLLNFAVFSRDYSKDFQTVRSFDYTDNFYDFIFNDDVQEFFDYLWIRLRVLIFIVSIYVLEMM